MCCHGEYHQQAFTQLPTESHWLHFLRIPRTGYPGLARQMSITELPIKNLRDHRFEHFGMAGVKFQCAIM